MNANMILENSKVALPPNTMLFPCETPEEGGFYGWELMDVADDTTWPGEPKDGRVVIYDAYLPTRCTGVDIREEDGSWLQLMQAIYTPSQKGVPFTGSFRIPNSPKIARRYGQRLTPDENGVRLFNPGPEDWDTCEFTHWVAVLPDEAVWIVNGDMSNVLIKSYPYPIATKADLTDWIRSGVAYGTMPAGEKVALRNTGETGTVVTAYRDDYAMGFVVALETRGYNVHVLPADITIDAAAQVTLQCQLAALR